jgi:hypothetical protein
MFQGVEGELFWMSNDVNDHKHPSFVLIVADDDALVVNLTDALHGHDATVTILPSECTQGTLIKDSHVYYAEAEIFTHARLVELVNRGNLSAGDRLHADAVARAQRGILLSPHTPRNIKKWVISVGL